MDRPRLGHRRLLFLRCCTLSYATLPRTSMKNKFNARFWLFASQSAHAKGGLRDFVCSCQTLTECIRILLDSYSGGYGWWQIYDAKNCIMMDSQDMFKEQECTLMELGQLDG